MWEQKYREYVLYKQNCAETALNNGIVYGMPASPLVLTTTAKSLANPALAIVFLNHVGTLISL